MTETTPTGGTPKTQPPPAVGDTVTVRSPARPSRVPDALIAAAQAFIADGTTDVPVLEITTRAGVGLGSFYNHFDSKAELFEAAVDEAALNYGRVLASLASPTDDPAQVFAQSFRLAGRLHRKLPIVSKSLIERAPSYLSRGGPLVIQIRTTLGRAADSGRLAIADIDLAVGTVLGALVMLGQRLHDHPEIDDGSASDLVAEGLLRMFGMSSAESRRLATAPLPVLTKTQE